MRKKELITICNKALANGSDICVEVTIPGQNDTEFIINSNQSIMNKLDYYCKKYDDNLVHMSAPDVKIVSVKEINFGDVHNKNKSVECEDCEREFVATNDMKREEGYLGCMYVECPYCGGKAYIDDESIDVTPSTLEFPKHFFNFSNGVDINNNEIQGWCRKGLNYLLKNKDDNFFHTGTGNSVVIGLRYEDEIDIIVAKGYYEFSKSIDEEEDKSIEQMIKDGDLDD